VFAYSSSSYIGGFFYYFGKNIEKIIKLRWKGNTRQHVTDFNPIEDKGINTELLLDDVNFSSR
jgi:hypothetical protein